jgi:hypothetical protein
MLQWLRTLTTDPILVYRKVNDVNWWACYIIQEPVATIARSDSWKLQITSELIERLT